MAMTTEAWRDRIVAKAESLYKDLDLASVRAWREAHQGAKAVGFMPIYVPRELIDAAGMLPVAMVGGGDQVDIIHGDALYQSYICQIPRSTIELASTGRYAQLDGFVFPSTCDVIRNLSGMWKVLFPDKYVRYLDVPQNFHPRLGGGWYRAELSALLRDLSALGGREVTDAGLLASIRRYDENRRAIASLAELRARQPWKVPAVEVYLVHRAGNVLPIEAHTAMVRDYLHAADAAGDRQKRDNVRVVMVGTFCEQPPLGLIRALERAGCWVISDDLLLGQRWISGDVAPDGASGDPLDLLVDAYLRRSAHAATRYEPGSQRGRDLIRTAKKLGAEGVIFAAPSFCDPALLDQPMLQEALDEARLPWTAFKYAENLGQFQVIREQAGTFSDAIKLWSES